MKKTILILLAAFALCMAAEGQTAPDSEKTDTVFVTDTLIETVIDTVIDTKEVTAGDYSTILTIILVIIGILTLVVLVVSVPFSIGMWRFHKEAKEKLVEMDDLLKKAGKSAEKIEDMETRAYKATEKPDSERTPEDRKIITAYTETVDSKPVGELTAIDWLLIGNKANIKKNYEAAINYYSIAIKMKPDYAEAFNNRGTAKYNLENYTGAIADYDRAIELKPDLAEAYGNRAKAYFDNGQFKKGDDDTKKAIELFSKAEDKAAAFVNRGNAKIYLKDYMGAMKDYDEAIRLKPDYAGGYHGLGICYTEKSEYERAIDYFNKAISIEKESPETYGYRALAYIGFGKLEKAKEDVVKCEELAPDKGYPHKNRAILDLYLDKIDEAMKEFEQAVKDPTVKRDIPIYNTLLKWLKENPDKADDVRARINEIIAPEELPG